MDGVCVAIQGCPGQCRRTRMITRIYRRASRQKPLRSIQTPTLRLIHKQSPLKRLIVHLRHGGPQSCLHACRATQVLNEATLVRPLAAIMLGDDEERIDRFILYVILVV